MTVGDGLHSCDIGEVTFEPDHEVYDRSADRTGLEGVSTSDVSVSLGDLDRTEWNHFLAPDGLGDGPFRLRALDLFGAALTDDAVPLLDDDEVEGPGRFPACP